MNLIFLLALFTAHVQSVKCVRISEADYNCTVTFDRRPSGLLKVETDAGLVTLNMNGLKNTVLFPASAETTVRAVTFNGVRTEVPAYR